MARKRKIPVRKHHGIRDPLKQLEEKEKKLKNILNCPPEKGGEQRVSNKFAEFKKLADRVKAGKKIKKPTFGKEDLPRASGKSKTQQNGSKIKAIKQFLNETDEDYLKRVNRLTTDSLKEAQYEAKYGVKIVRNSKTGEISIKKKPKNEIDELLKQKQKERLNRKNKKKSKINEAKLDPREVKELVKKAISEDNEEKKASEKKIEEYKQDVIRFGEIVHAPPSLTTIPRKAQKSETVPRPGQKDNLLLKKIIEADNDEGEADNSSGAVVVKKSKLSIQTPTKAQLKGKRKSLPAHTRSMLEAEREKLVDIYRQLKKSKLKSS